ncbi:MAG: DNA polymerase III subunit gamma/tau, partial [Oscillospiraceae bacterium]|nr:DNA polymerase III subunit gamma/tau [Oscillospiraceae bacterium]
MYQALYRKWRPKTFSDVIGQSHITETLQKQVAEGRTSHAYLFTGTRGTGKTTCAKILAKAVNCEHPVNGDPCNRCASCLGIENGSFLDVLELDAASNNGVDQVRALRDEAIYSPANVKKRVYIVDEVHMLSTAAFNALLKILEEPPEHLMFILATTELHKVPATILSRCQRFSFKRITPQDVAKRLTYVAGQEDIDLTADGAELLSRLADGALRDGLSLLDQCAAAGGTIDSAAVLEVLGLAGNLQTAQLMECVLRRDAKAALLLLNQLYAGGKDVGAVLGELSTLTRDLLLRRTAPEGGAALLSGGYDSATLDRLGKEISASRLIYLASTLQKATADLYYSSNRRTDAELCLLRLCDESLSGDLTALESRIQRLEEAQARGAVIRTAVEQSAGTAASPVPKAAPKPEPPVEDAPPWEEPPLPEEPPMAEEPGERVFDIPAEPAPKRRDSVPAAPAAPTQQP